MKLIQRFTLLFVALLALASADVARGQALTWDANASSTGNQDGSGTWSTGTNTWWNGTTNVVWSNGSDAAFQGTGVGGNKTITVTGGVTVNNIVYSSTAGPYTYSAGTAGQLTITGTISGSGFGAPTFNVPIVGSSVINAATGITLGGNNTYTGLTTATTASIIVTRDNALGTTDAGTVIGVNSSSANSLILSGAFNYTTAEPLTIYGIGASGGGALRKESGSGSFAGPITLGNNGVGITTVNATLFTVSGAIGEAASNFRLNIGASSGTVALTGNNTFSGGVSIGGGNSPGVLSISSEANLGAVPAAFSANNITFSEGFYAGAVGTGSRLRVTADVDLSANRGITFSNERSAFDVVSGATFVVNGQLSRTSAGGFTKLGGGTMVLAGTTTPSFVLIGGVFVNEGRLRLDSFANVNSISGMTVSGGTLAFGSGITSGTVAQLLGTGGTVDLTNAGGNPFTLSIGSGTAVSGTAAASIVGTGGLVIRSGSYTQTLTGSNTYSGGTQVTAGTLQVGDGGTVGSIVGNVSLVSGSSTLILNRSDAISFPGTISGSGSLIKRGAGTLGLSAANSFTGNATIGGGLVTVTTLGNAGVAGELGAGTTISIGSATDSGTLRYTGASTTSNRVIDLAGTTGGATIEANGSGSLVFTGNNTASGAGTKTFTLTGTSTAANSIGVINGTGVSVTKSGPGRWQIIGDGNYSGRLTVLDGTLVVAPVGSGNSPFGSSTGSSSLPLIGNSAVGAGGTAALLGQNGTISRGFWVDQSNGSQVVVLGGVGSGTTTFASGQSIYLGRDVTLQAEDNGTAEFAMTWRDFSTGSLNPVVGFTIGSTGNAGTVVFGRQLPTTATAVSVVAGTLRPNDNERIVYTTPVSLGATSGSATLDLNSYLQSLASLSFTGNGSRVTSTAAGGKLLLYTNGTASAVVNVNGTGHLISSDVSLDDPAAFNVNPAARLRVSGAISGSSGASLTKTGLGTLELSGTSSYPGATTVAAGSLLVNGQLTDTAVTVQSGGLLGGSGEISGFVNVLAGGTLSPGNSPGLITTGSLSLAGTTLMEITGTSTRGVDYDAVNVSGLLTYGGSMLIDFAAGLSSPLPNGTEFNLFDFGSSSGSFSTITTSSNSWYGNLTFTNSGGTWTAQKDSQRLEFTQSTGNLVIVPEPASLALAAIGIAAAATTAFRARNRCRRGRTGPRSSWQPV